MKICTCECNCKEEVDYLTFRAHYYSVSVAKLKKGPIPPLVCKKCMKSH